MSQPFTSIVRSGNVDTLAAAIASKKGGSLDAIDEDGFTALFLASRKAATYPMVSHLLAAGADVDLKGIDRETPLYIASFNGLLDTVKVLIKGRANVNEVNGSFKDTALHTAARLGFVDIIETLLDAGANINFRNAALETPLFVAAMAGRFEAVYCLLNRGANKTIGNAETKDPLFIASERGHKGIVELLKAEKQYLANVRGNVMHDEKAKAPPLRPTSAITAKAEQQEQQQAAAAAAAVPVPVPAPPPTKPAAVGATSSSSSSSAPRKASPAPTTSTTTTKVVAPPAAAAAPSSSPKPAPAPKTPPPAPVVVQQTPVVQIDVHQPAPRTHDPLTGKKLAVCKTLVEAGYWYPPTAPEGAIKPNPELKANYGGTQMVVGTGCEPEVEVRQRPQFTPLAGDVFATVILPKGKGKVV